MEGELLLLPSLQSPERAKAGKRKGKGCVYEGGGGRYTYETIIIPKHALQPDSKTITLVSNLHNVGQQLWRTQHAQERRLRCRPHFRVNVS